MPNTTTAKPISLHKAIVSRSNRTKAVCPQPTCASLKALGPGMIELCVAAISTVLEPSATASATAEFERFLGGAALGACGTDGF